MAREDFHSTDLAGAAYYAGIFGAGLDPVDDRPSRVEAEFDLGLFVLPASWEGVGGPRLLSGVSEGIVMEPRP